MSRYLFVLMSVLAVGGAGTLEGCATPYRLDSRERNTGRDDRRDDRGSRDNRDNRPRNELGRGNQVYRNIDATTQGDGLLRMSGVRDGRFAVARIRLGTSRDVSIDIDRGTRGTIRGEIIDVRDSRVVIRVINVLGNRGSGELIAQMQSEHEVDRLNGSGGSSAGSWQFDFEGTERRERDRGRGSDGYDRGGWSRGAADVTGAGYGTLSQDVGPSLEFDRVTVTLQGDRAAIVILEGRRQPVRLTGRWSPDRSDDLVSIDLSRINEMRATGRLNVRLSSRAVSSLEGGGSTDRGRFRVSFDRR